MIRFDNVHIGYTSVLVSIDSLELNKGQLYILAGRNGVGKSTLLRALSKQQKVIKGEIYLNETPLSAINQTAVANFLSLVNPAFPNIDFMRVWDYVSLGRTPHTNALGRLSKRDQSITDEALKMLEIEQLNNKFTSELSDGECQLVAIARALAQETAIILLDEPTAFLDYANKIRVLQLLKKIALETDKCIVLSSHDIELSIDINCPFLVIDTKEKELTLLPAPVIKDDVIKLAFG